MKNYPIRQMSRTWPIACSISLALLPGSPLSAAHQPGRGSSSSAYADGLLKWSPATSVNIRYFNRDAVQMSPDGSMFFVYNWHGDLVCDCNAGELNVYVTKKVKDGLKDSILAIPGAIEPLRSLRRSNSGNDTDPPNVLHSSNITQPHWLSDSKTIEFSGISELGRIQLYDYNVVRDEIVQVTNWAFDSYFIQRHGDSVWSLLWMPEIRPARPPYPSFPITRETILRALSGGEKYRLSSFFSTIGGPAWSLRDALGSEFADIDFFAADAFSPDGTKLIFAVRREKPAKGWPANFARPGKFGLSQFVMVDFLHHRVTPILDAPVGTATSVGARAYGRVQTNVFWTSDARHFLLVNTAWNRRGAKFADMAYIVYCGTQSLHCRIVEPLEALNVRGTRLVVSGVDWDASSDTLTVRHSGAGVSQFDRAYSFRGEGWKSIRRHSISGQNAAPANKAPDTAQLSIRVRQDDNHPPLAIASYGDRTATLTSPDPALKGVWLAPEKPFVWFLPDGRKMIAGLILPREQRGTPLPLVIQAYSYSPDVFAPDGPTRHLYAAQSLAARGFAVLNMNIPAVDTPNSSFLHKPFVDRVESAIEELSKRGIVDPHRIALVGFSNAGHQTYYLITHPGKFRIGAAIIDDAFTGTYAEQFTNVAAGTPDAANQLYGGNIWQRANIWLREESALNVDKVQTPTLFSVHQLQQIGSSVTLETIGAFLSNRRPIEYLVYPYAGHELSMPRQRMASQQTTVDWIDFWLNGHLPADASEAARWIVLRDDWNRQKAWEALGHPIGSVPDQDFDAI